MTKKHCCPEIDLSELPEFDGCKHPYTSIIERMFIDPKTMNILDEQGNILFKKGQYSISIHCSE